MDEQPARSFQLDYSATVTKAIRDLGKVAIQYGFLQEYVNALKSIVNKLTHHPLEFGEPLNNTILDGGVTCLGIVRPVVVKFVVLQNERLVVILNVQLLMPPS